MNEEILQCQIDEYLSRYCKKHNVTPEEALQHKIVQEVSKYYEIQVRGGV